MIAIVVATTGAIAAGPLRPNILILVGDDHAGGTLGVDGDPRRATPRLDRLAAQGVQFRRAYCNAPVCTASRQSFITGRLPHAVGVTRLPTPLPNSAVTLGDWLGARGYATAAYGKMHFNSQAKHGFVDRLDTPDWLRHLRAHPPVGGDHRKPWRPLKDPTSVWLNAAHESSGLPIASAESTFYVDRAGEFFLHHEHEPFALVVGFPEPHSPFLFPNDWPRRFDPSEFSAPELTEFDRRDQPRIFREITPDQSKGIQAAYYTSMSFLDHQVGRVLDALDASGLADSTIVVYLGDNGYMRGYHGRFEKHCFYEQAVRVPLILRWPGHLPEGAKIDAMVEHVDLLPTLLDLAGVSPPHDLHGRSLVPLATGRPGAEGRSVVFSEYLENEEAMASGPHYKLIVGTGHRKRLDGYETDHPTPGPYERLYDLDTDPSEDHNLADHPELALVRDRLRSALLERLTTTRNANDPAPEGLSPIETIHRLLVPKD